MWVGIVLVAMRGKDIWTTALLKQEPSVQDKHTWAAEAGANNLL